MQPKIEVTSYQLIVVTTIITRLQCSIENRQYASYRGEMGPRNVIKNMGTSNRGRTIHVLQAAGKPMSNLPEKRVVIHTFEWLLVDLIICF